MVMFSFQLGRAVVRVAVACAAVGLAACVPRPGAVPALGHLVERELGGKTAEAASDQMDDLTGADGGKQRWTPRRRALSYILSVLLLQQPRCSGLALQPQ
jgi:hypothetical protein